MTSLGTSAPLWRQLQSLWAVLVGSSCCCLRIVPRAVWWLLVGQIADHRGESYLPLPPQRIAHCAERFHPADHSPLSRYRFFLWSRLDKEPFPAFCWTGHSVSGKTFLRKRSCLLFGKLPMVSAPGEQWLLVAEIWSDGSQGFGLADS